ncbi:serine-rich adhesin for platelets isoform X1 [Magallana gigas]|uniref:serine-rich adhesin for platelets isoform X1 n=1 Tax=Magallana gigas TaxID=29159 RepID=UPI00333F8537
MISYHKIYMSPVQSSNLQSQLCGLWKKQKLCDAVIKSDKMSVMAHRLVLAASCPMLQSMENYSFGSLLEIRVESDMTKESVMAFLQYLYEGYLMLTEENYIYVENLARSMHIDSIVSCCKDFSKSILSSRSKNHGRTDKADFKHVRKTNLLTVVLDSSQKQPYESCDSDFSKSLKQPSSDHCSSESITFKQVSPLCATQSQGGGMGGTVLKQGPSTSDQSESYLTSSNMVSANVNTKKASGEGVIFFANANFKEGSSTSLSSTGPRPVPSSRHGSQLNGCPLARIISNDHSPQTIESSNSELGKKTKQAEPYPVLLKQVPKPHKFLSGDSSRVSESCAGIDQNNEQPVLSPSSSIQQIDIHLNESSKESIEKSNSQTHTSARSSAMSTKPSAEADHSTVKMELEDSIIHTDEGMFLSSAQRGETQTSQPHNFLSGDFSRVSESCAGIDQNNEQPVLSPSSSIQQLDIHLNESIEKSNSQTHTSASSSAMSTKPSAEADHSIVKMELEDSIIHTDEGMFLSTAQRDETQTSQSSSLHDKPSMSSESSSSQDEMSSSSVNAKGLEKVKRRNIAGRVYVSGMPTGIDFRKKVIDYMERNGARRGEYPILRGLRKKAALHFKVCPTTITNFWAQYCKEGCVKTPVRVNQGRKRKLSQEDIEYIQFLKQSKPSMQLSDVRNELLKKSNLKKTVCLATIYRTLEELNMTSKKKSKEEREQTISTE